MLRTPMFTFDEILTQVTDLMQQQGRVSYRALKRRFSLDDEYLEDLKAELIDAKRWAVDEDGKVLVWTGASPVPSPQSPTPIPQSPSSYTPAHLAGRIRAEQAAMESRGSADGERKTITALFADLKGSSALIEGLDPEEARAIIDPALQLMMDAVHRLTFYEVLEQVRELLQSKGRISYRALKLQFDIDNEYIEGLKDELIEAEQLAQDEGGKVLTLDRSLEDIVPYLFALLGINDPQSSLQQMDAQIRRKRTFEALKKLSLHESLNQPLLLLFEDLHWIDNETQGFLDTLSESVASADCYCS
jgi:hypothetical protein